MSKKERTYFALFLLGVGLLGVDRGWEQVCYNLGAGILFWLLGHTVRESENRNKRK